MPITQPRMLDLITAADILLTRTLNSAVKAVAIRDNQVHYALQELERLGPTAAPDCIDTLKDAIDQLVELATKPIDMQTQTIILQEKAHFRARRSSNDAARRYQRNKRLARFDERNAEE